MSTTQSQCLGENLSSASKFQLPANEHPCKQQLTAQVFRSLPPTCKTKTEFLVSHSSLDPTQLLKATKSEIVDERYVSMSQT